MSLISAYRLENNVFLSSILLNIFGGLCTGLIILVYQFYSKKKEDEIIYIIDKLASIDNINIKEASILDFRTDECIVNEQDENYIEEVLSYD
ncbi:hypothetical protein P5F73_14120 [Clostridium perfringens]|nr:hypothetical protein [Clostridium perfringens]